MKVEEEESLSSKMVVENDPLLNDSENHAGKQISSEQFRAARSRPRSKVWPFLSSLDLSL